MKDFPTSIGKICANNSKCRRRGMYIKANPRKATSFWNNWNRNKEGWIDFEFGIFEAVISSNGEFSTFKTGDGRSLVLCFKFFELANKNGYVETHVQKVASTFRNIDALFLALSSPGERMLALRLA